MTSTRRPHGGAKPERARDGRSFDYRYAWIRDQRYVGHAVAATGAYPLLDGAVHFVGDRLRADGAALEAAYAAPGGRVPDQREIALPGYPGGANVVGNQVDTQFQLDVRQRRLRGNLPQALVHALLESAVQQHELAARSA